MSLSVGSILHQERQKQKLSLEHISQRTKIRLEYLRALESDDYDKLPSSAYALGFIKTYCREIGLQAEKLTPFFRRQYTKDLRSKNPIPASLNKPLAQSFWPRLAPPSPVALLLGLALLAAFIFLALQFKEFFTVPKLTLISPLHNLKTESEEVQVTGQTEPEATVSINQQEIKINPRGEFSQTIKLLKGENIITVKVTNKLNKEAVIIRRVIRL